MDFKVFLKELVTEHCSQGDRFDSLVKNMTQVLCKLCQTPGGGVTDLLELLDWYIFPNWQLYQVLRNSEDWANYYCANRFGTLSYL